MPSRSSVTRRRQRHVVVSALVILGWVFAISVFAPTSGAAAPNPCGPPVVSIIACENTLPGDPASDWQVSGAGDATIQGFATAMSVNLGETVMFKINTPASSYHLDILRMGYYQGNGARKVASGVRPSAALPQAQPACVTDSTTGLIDCGNWAASASWTVPTTAVSGVYLAHLVRDDTGGGSLIPFVVRNDASHSDLVVQTSDETWQAYNTYGGNSLYQCTVACPPGNPGGYKAAYKVSYNRPFHTALDDSGHSWVMYTEYPMIRFLEANGYDLSYVSGLDVASRGSLLLNHKTFLSVGHDEYWSGDQRANVESARDHGVNLAFFSGNEVFWKTRWENSTVGGTTAGRTLVTYKETHFDAPVDPQDPPTWTGTWRDPRFSPPGDGGRPENALTGQFFVVNAGTADIQVPSQYSKLRLWRNTPVANLVAGQSATLGAGIGTLGYEWDEDADNGSRPVGLLDLSSTTVAAPQVFVDYGTNVAPGTVTHHLTEYRAPSGALVFGAGTVQWAWGLDGATTGKAPDPVMQQATVNLLADMGAQPYASIPGLTTATPSTDTSAPTSSISSPVVGATAADGAKVTVTGTASDTGGGLVAGVEVSTDGGTNWHPATGTTNWTYTWVAHGNPTSSIRSRAVDDSGNVEVPSAGTSVNVTCPCSIWGPNVTPGGVDSGDKKAIEVGVKFTTDTFGTVSGLRFYKASTNTGTHVGNLWTASGQLLARATFTGESASGWQTVSFTQPVAINTNTTYVASYYAPVGHYSQDEGYMYRHPAPEPDGNDSVDSAPLHLQRNTPANPNGLYSYSPSTTFPTSTFSAENYWVDVIFTASPPPGQPTGVTANAGYASAGVSWAAPTTGAVTSYTVTPYIGSTAQTSTIVTGSPAPPTGTVVSGLTNGVTYTFVVTAANPNGTSPASTPSNEVTPSASASLVQNGGFESGLLSWTAGGIALPAANGSVVHSGSGSALVGRLSGAEPLGDSSLTQTITLPPTGTTTLSFWYRPGSTDGLCSGSACVWDWQEAQLRTPAGVTLASIFKSNSNSQTWTQVSANVTAYDGQTLVLWFNVHEDGASPPDDTWFYLDDVSVAGSLPTAPAAPTAVTAVAGNGSATVSWTAPTNGGSPITAYTVTPYIGATAQTPITIAGNPPATNTTITGLTNSTAYTFTVTATNVNGTGPASTPSNAVTPSAPTPPAAPTAVTAVAGNGSATVSWTAPTNGGSPITAYTVTPYIGATAQTPITIAGNPPATNTTITGLTNSTAYTFTVTATNVNGTGPASTPSNAVTPSAPTPPAAPTAVTAVAGNGSATVSWTAPTNGGSPITAYTVTPYIGATAQTPITIAGNPPATNTTITGLTNSTAYTFTVTATNVNGTGPASTPSNAVTPSAVVVPAFVQKVTAHTPGATSLSVTPTSALGAGDRLIVTVGVWNAAHATTTAVTDTAGDTFTEVSHFVAADFTEQSVWTAPITTGVGAKPTIKATVGSSADIGIAVAEYSGLSTAAGTAAIDTQAHAVGLTGGGTSVVSSGATTAIATGNELAVGFYTDSGFGDTLTAGSGYIARAIIAPTSDMELVLEDQIVPAGTTPNAAVSTGARTYWLMNTIVFKTS